MFKVNSEAANPFELLSDSSNLQDQGWQIPVKVLFLYRLNPIEINEFPMLAVFDLHCSKSEHWALKSAENVLPFY